MKNHYQAFSALAGLGLLAMIGSGSAKADTIQQCENIGRPANYLTVQTNVDDLSCYTKKAIRYSTPAQGLTILKPQELSSFKLPYWAVTTVNESAAGNSYIINQVRDGLVACADGPRPSYDYFSVANGKIGNCGHLSESVGNSVRYGKVFFLTINTTDSVNRVSVQLNSSNPSASVLNYIVRTTATLNGNTSSASKQGYTTNGIFRLEDVAPSLVSQAQQGASFRFEVEVFAGQTSVSKETVTADGSRLVAPTTVAPLWCATCNGSIRKPTSGEVALQSGQSLPMNQPIYRGSYKLVFQGDGNLVVYGAGDSVKWASYSQNQGGDTAVMQTDGNLVIYANGRAIWNAGTYNNAGAYLVFQDNGELAVVRP